jgi:hypothetical protein
MLIEIWSIMWSMSCARVSKISCFSEKDFLFMLRYSMLYTEGVKLNMLICCIRGNVNTVIFNSLIYKNASAGNRTRVNCLEGSYAHHYTTDASHFKAEMANMQLFIHAFTIAGSWW